MRSKFTLTCKACKCKMEFRPRPDALTSPIVCQSCGQALPEAYEGLLAIAMKSIYNLPESTQKDGMYYDKDGFLFEVEVFNSLADQEE